MNIQWFPGHMTKTRRLIEENLTLVDICIEIADARLVNSSRSPLLSDLISNKPQLLIINKADISDEAVNQMWHLYFKSQNINSLFVNSRDGGKLFNKVSAEIRKILADTLRAREEKGIKNKSVRAMVTGIPNVGKSTFINNISGRKSTKTGDRPGVTTGKQWITVNGLELLDTPGILAPKFLSETQGEHLAMSGAVRDAVFDTLELSCILIEFLRDNYCDLLCKRFKLYDIKNLRGFEIMEQICKNRGYLRRGGDFDYERAASIILDEFRGAKIGRISLEKPQI